LNHLTVPSAMFATFIQKTKKFTGLPDSLFELGNPVPAATLMQRESKHKRFLPLPSSRVNKFC
jgi:hypothetical protein